MIIRLQILILMMISIGPQFFLKKILLQQMLKILRLLLYLIMKVVIRMCYILHW